MRKLRSGRTKKFAKVLQLSNRAGTRNRIFADPTQEGVLSANFRYDELVVYLGVDSPLILHLSSEVFFACRSCLFPMSNLKVWGCKERSWGQDMRRYAAITLHDKALWLEISLEFVKHKDPEMIYKTSVLPKGNSGRSINPCLPQSGVW